MIYVEGVLPRVGWVLLRLCCVIAGAKIIKAIYRATAGQNDEGISTFSTHWRKNARDAIYGLAGIGLLFYVLEGGNITISGTLVLFLSALLILFVTGETILGHWEETLDAIESLPGPSSLKIVVGIWALIVTAAVSIFYVSQAIRSEW
jgi:hypothetical protein